MNEKIEALITANEYMNNLEKGIDMLVNYIKSNNINKGMELIPDIADGISWVTQVISLTREVQKKSIDISIIDEKLNEIVEAIENEDIILVSDLFNYEILPILQSIHQEIKDIIIS